MADIAKIQLEIEAVQVALKSFARFSDELQRSDHLIRQLDTVQHLDVYCRFSEVELKEALKLLSEKEIMQQDERYLLLEQEKLLRAQQRGGIFI